MMKRAKTKKKVRKRREWTPIDLRSGEVETLAMLKHEVILYRMWLEMYLNYNNNIGHEYHMDKLKIYFLIMNCNALNRILSI